MTVRIRPATGEDLDDLEEVHEAAIRGVDSDAYTDPELDAWTAFPGGAASYPVDEPGIAVFVAERDGDVVGFAQLDHADGEVEKVYVHPDHGRSGVGSALMDHLVAVAGDRGVDSLYVEASLNAVPFYERCGFEQFDAHEKPVSTEETRTHLRVADMRRSI